MSECFRSAVAAHRIDFAYGKRPILRDVSLDVRFGEVVGLLGPNGTGKSTLMAVMAGDVSAHSGYVEYQGKKVQDYGRKELARTRSVMPQVTEFPFSYTVRDIVAMGRHCWDTAPEEDDSIIDSSLEKTDICGYDERDVTRLSGGEKARVTFARVLTQQAGVVFLDEPTAALDIAHQERTMTVCRELADAGHAVVAVMHDLQLAGSYCDRIALMSEGRIVRLGTPTEVLTAQLLTDVYSWPIDVATVGDRIVVLPSRTHR
ncbi:heme ABC transporter ATP-binding protein [Arcanobacterium haemolyticum]|uniref:ABC transporter related protein n=1 Tax=Arcanobacterium haemolyticum (strain ATCC 9345 / DSM 20595 / CCM 5947 / CCUG 17215 / LMG 16163 / NBRC 15585 / NCTC 8452 / 11018) TaxID=644284 RepID=D7BN67_ARCHD|nr:heme ABC transporter ATP-binding protein [Arcanobacterium haemolyticum]ADH92366.1 ABC transporter related protein [Arcanobacterium haemolyticum DSM 20595]SQH28907.1 Hemin import ATP-binding protein HmuV [Arcanobacterium haemolyticum]